MSQSYKESLMKYRSATTTELFLLFLLRVATMAFFFLGSTISCSVLAIRLIASVIFWRAYHPQDELAGGIPKIPMHYEVCYLLSAALSSEEIASRIEKYRNFIEDQNGKVHRLEDWGKKRLAYRIDGRLEANYVLMNFEIMPNLIKALSNEMDRVRMRVPYFLQNATDFLKFLYSSSNF